MCRIFLSVLLVSAGCRAVEPIYVKEMPVPHYPAVARMALVQGSTRVDIRINSDGTVSAAKATGGDPILQRSAESNVRLWCFGFASQIKEFPIRHSVLFTYKIVGERAVNPGCASVLLHLPDRIEISARPPVLYPNRTRK